MIKIPKIGTTAELQFTVEASHAINFSDENMPTVLSTPWLIWFLEHSAHKALQPVFDQEESSVGIRIDVEHLAATPLGHEVVCRARIINIAETLITFQIEAHDEHEKIAKGTHQRRVIDAKRFAQRIQKKIKTEKS